NPPPPSTCLSSSPHPSTLASFPTRPASDLPSTATGTVTFKDGSTSLGTGTLSNGTATLTLSTLATGPHSLTAVYGGDANDAASTSGAVTQTVNPVPVPLISTLSVNPTSIIEGSSTTLQGTFTDDPSVSLTVTNCSPVITSISGPTSFTLRTGPTGTFTVNLTDAGVLDLHACTWMWGDLQSSQTATTESNGSGSCTTSHTYKSAGTYTMSI